MQIVITAFMEKGDSSNKATDFPSIPIDMKISQDILSMAIGNP